MNMLEKIQRELEKEGIEVEIQNMEANENVEKREEIIEIIKSQERELKSWLEKEDWIMVAVLSNRIKRNAEKILKAKDEE